MSKKPEDIDEYQLLNTALTTNMEYRTPEMHKMIISAANNWLTFSKFIRSALK